MVTRIRAFKVGCNLDKKAHLRLFLHLPADRADYAAYFPLLKSMENCDAEAVPSAEALPQGMRDSFAGLTWCLKVPVEELTPEFLARVHKEIAKLEEEVKRADARLANADFIGKAKPEVIEEAKRKREAMLARAQTLKDNFAPGE